MCLSDVDECEDPDVCGAARCENKEGGYDCLCEPGYVYDNETKSCIGECLQDRSGIFECSHSRFGRMSKPPPPIKKKGSFGISQNNIKISNH